MIIIYVDLDIDGIEINIISIEFDTNIIDDNIDINVNIDISM